MRIAVQSAEGSIGYRPVSLSLFIELLSQKPRSTKGMPRNGRKRTTVNTALRDEHHERKMGCGEVPYCWRQPTAGCPGLQHKRMGGSDDSKQNREGGIWLTRTPAPPLPAANLQQPQASYCLRMHRAVGGQVDSRWRAPAAQAGGAAAVRMPFANSSSHQHAGGPIIAAGRAAGSRNPPGPGSSSSASIASSHRGVCCGSCSIIPYHTAHDV